MRRDSEQGYAKTETTSTQRGDKESGNTWEHSRKNLNITRQRKQTEHNADEIRYHENKNRKWNAD